MEEENRTHCKVTFYYANGRIESPGVYGTRAELTKLYQEVMGRRFKSKVIQIEGLTNSTVIDLGKIINIIIEESNEQKLS